jgi:hypothetical protein
MITISGAILREVNPFAVSFGKMKFDCIAANLKMGDCDPFNGRQISLKSGQIYFWGVAKYIFGSR